MSFRAITADQKGHGKLRFDSTRNDNGCITFELRSNIIAITIIIIIIIIFKFTSNSENNE